MTERFKSAFIVLNLLAIISSCTDSPEKTLDVLSGSYWKNQALEDIMPFWTGHSRDDKYGAFYTNLDSVWVPFGSQDKYPSMISRHLFSYSSAYLLSGNREYIIVADSTFKWLLEKAWDKEHGGWFDALDQSGNPVLSTKTTFVQVYAITGLSIYYFVTRDSTALEYIERSNELLEQNVWDDQAGGYFNVMNRDWSVSDSSKSFSSQITPVSGYLIYLYMATREQKYLDQINRILEVTMKNMVDDKSGWILEDFERDWNYIQGRDDASEINIGHNIEVAWMLLRNFLLTGYQPHLVSARSFSDNFSRAGVLKENGFWQTATARSDPSQHGSDTYWWVQAYGNMFSLYLYHVTHDSKFLDDYRKGAVFWDLVFMDREHGDTFFSADSAGRITDETKATRFKASYHSMEQCLLNLLCLNLWVSGDPVEFHFRVTSSDDSTKLFPVLLEDKDILIQKVLIDGKDRSSLAYGQTILLPELVNSQVTVFLINRGFINKTIQIKGNNK